MRIVQAFAVAALLLTAAGCTGSNDEPAPGGTAAPSVTPSAASSSSDADVVAGTASLPKKGDCWSLTSEQIDPGSALTGVETAAIDCSSAHNAITLAVVGVPTGQDTSIGALAQSGEALSSEDDEAWKNLVIPACTASYAQGLGSGSVAVNKKWAQGAYRSVNLAQRVWLPTADDWAAGARWIRCDLVGQTSDPIALKDVNLDLTTVPDDLASCLNANSEGFLYVACDDPLVNAQSLVTMVVGEGGIAAAKAQYDEYTSSLAPMICQEAVKGAFPGVTQEVKAALPIQQAFTGTYECYVDRGAGEPLIK